MSTATKKITSLIFILLWFTPLLFTLYITIQKENIFKRMKEKMETHSLQSIVVPEKDIVWMDDHEIWVNEQMFDIRTKKLENGVYFFTGMYDEEETKLVAKERRSGSRQQEDNRIFSQIFQCLHTMFFEQNYSPLAFYQPIDFYSHPGDETVKVFSPIITPPPRKVC